MCVAKLKDIPVGLLKNEAISSSHLHFLDTVIVGGQFGQGHSLLIVALAGFGWRSGRTVALSAVRVGGCLAHISNRSLDVGKPRLVDQRARWTQDDPGLPLHLRFELWERALTYLRVFEVLIVAFSS